MSKIDSAIMQQIEGAEKRYNRSRDKRDQLQHEMDKVARGEAPDWRVLDQKARYVRRLELLGMDQAAEAVIDEEASGFNPLERILGANQLTDISFLERAITASRTVARIEIRGHGGGVHGYGSGVMVSPRLIMTNNHVLGNKAAALNSIAQFEYITSATGIAMDAHNFRLLPNEFFVTNKNLDFTLVAVEPVNPEGEVLRDRGWSPLIAGSGKAVLGERVNIIQHPGGERMMVTMRDNTIVAVIDEFMQYKADTMQGSSGSPVYNEQWELAALHHAGVPERDSQGRILLRDGSVWNGRREDVDQISWIANEGIRISRIVKHVENLQLTAAARTLWQETFTAPTLVNIWDLFRGAAQIPARPVNTPPAQEMATNNNSAEWFFRLAFGPVGSQTPGVRQVDQGVSSSPATTGLPTTARIPALVVGDTSRLDAISTDEPTIDTSVESLAEQTFERFRHDGPYYNEQDDEASRDAYWDGIDFEASPEALADALQVHLEETHDPRHSYSTARLKFLYPAIDVREDGTLQNVYSGTVLDPREVIANEISKVLPRAEALGFEMDGIDLDQLLQDDRLWDAIEEQPLEHESTIAFNCEHVVCQSWFDKRQPMRADLHHLFTCEPGCNSFRSNIPYWSFSLEDEAVRDSCGRREGNKFEPQYGHGPVARATMYFLMRYPGEVGNRRQELTKSRVNVLLNWHENYPPDRYEQHRNWLTEKAQGNRNPFIDFPDLAERELLIHGFGSN